MYTHPDLGAVLRSRKRGDSVMQPDTPPGAPLTPAIVFENLQAYQRTFALKAAIELDVFRAVGEGPLRGRARLGFAVAGGVGTVSGGGGNKECLRRGRWGNG